MLRLSTSDLIIYAKKLKARFGNDSETKLNFEQKIDKILSDDPVTKKYVDSKKRDVEIQAINAENESKQKKAQELKIAIEDNNKKIDQLFVKLSPETIRFMQETISKEIKEIESKTVSYPEDEISELEKRDWDKVAQTVNRYREKAIRDAEKEIESNGYSTHTQNWSHLPSPGATAEELKEEARENILRTYNQACKARQQILEDLNNDLKKINENEHLFLTDQSLALIKNNIKSSQNEKIKQEVSSKISSEESIKSLKNTLNNQEEQLKKLSPRPVPKKIPRDHNNLVDAIHSCDDGGVMIRNWLDGQIQREVYSNFNHMLYLSDVVLGDSVLAEKLKTVEYNSSLSYLEKNEIGRALTLSEFQSRELLPYHSILDRRFDNVEIEEISILFKNQFYKYIKNAKNTLDDESLKKLQACIKCLNFLNHFPTIDQKNQKYFFEYFEELQRKLPSKNDKIFKKGWSFNKPNNLQEAITKLSTFVEMKRIEMKEQKLMMIEKQILIDIEKQNLPLQEFLKKTDEFRHQTKAELIEKLDHYILDEKNSDQKNLAKAMLRNLKNDNNLSSMIEHKENHKLFYQNNNRTPLGEIADKLLSFERTSVAIDNRIKEKLREEANISTFSPLFQSNNYDFLLKEVESERKMEEKFRMEYKKDIPITPGAIEDKEKKELDKRVDEIKNIWNTTQEEKENLLSHVASLKSKFRLMGKTLEEDIAEMIWNKIKADDTKPLRKETEEVIRNNSYLKNIYHQCFLFINKGRNLEIQSKIKSLLSHSMNKEKVAHYLIDQLPLPFSLMVKNLASEIKAENKDRADFKKNNALLLSGLSTVKTTENKKQEELDKKITDEMLSMLNRIEKTKLTLLSDLKLLEGKFKNENSLLNADSAKSLWDIIYKDSSSIQEGIMQNIRKNSELKEIFAKRCLPFINRSIYGDIETPLELHLHHSTDKEKTAHYFIDHLPTSFLPKVKKTLIDISVETANLAIHDEKENIKKPLSLSTTAQVIKMEKEQKKSDQALIEEADKGLETVDQSALLKKAASSSVSVSQAQSHHILFSEKHTPQPIDNSSKKRLIIN